MILTFNWNTGFEWYVAESAMLQKAPDDAVKKANSVTIDD